MNGKSHSFLQVTPFIPRTGIIGSSYIAFPVDTATPIVRICPVIVTNPISQIVLEGGDIELSVVVTGDEPLRYQWRFNGGAIPGAISSVLSLTNILSNQQGSYDVVVTNPCGSVTSNPAIITVISPVVIQDFTWPTSSWTVVASLANTTGSIDVSQQAGGPSGIGTYRQVIQEFPVMGGDILYVHLYVGPTPNIYNPATNGEVDHITYTQQNNLSVTLMGSAIGCHFVIKQDSKYYIPTVGDLTYSNTNGAWFQQNRNFNTTQWQELNMVTGAVQAGVPDFSVSGGIMQFGFLTSNTSATNLTNTAGFDDWVVTIYPALP